MDSADEFGEFVHATGARLYRAALLLTGDHFLAEDLTQATYAKVFAAWRRSRVVDNPLAYARKTLLHVYISHRRLRRNTEQAINPDDLAELSLDRDVADDSAARIDVLAALAALSAPDRAVVVLRYWEDRSVTETALDLGITEVAVRTRARRALQRLRPLLEPHERTRS
ncbi:MAG: sigma-70 family RNA polymerase sigma factor [Nocardioidaceae bacterium]|nr:MAG: sigma-70 family RNA polymerase sigma factor [Nocardioidaceae bacterium]